MEQARSCHVCHGTGQEIIEICEYCDGAGRIEEKVEKNIDVPAGIENGMSIKMRDE
jgi:molecular chaperone DnaJ